MNLRRGLLLPVALAAVALAGCGTSSRPVGRIRGTTLSVYFSGPLHGASSVSAQAALNGAQLALAEAHSRVGKYRIVLRPLDDSTPQSDGWDPSQTTVNARMASKDPTTIGYLGEFNSGASAVSIPLLNRAGIAQISPGSTAVGMTSAGTGAAPGEPQKYYPLGTRTFARVIPNDAIQALALVHVQQTLGCHSMFVLHDSEVDGEDTALTYVLTAQSAALRVVGIQAFQRHAADYGSLAAGIAAAGADCLLISAIDEQSSVLLTRQLAHLLPDATIFVSNGLADSAYFDPAAGGIPASLDPRVLVASATLDASSYPPSGQRFLAQYARAFGPPEPSAIYGYAAMGLMLRAISRATDGGHKAAQRSAVIHAILSTARIGSPLGTYRINSGGDTSINRYGIYRIVDGKLSFLEAGG
ncbi:MAG TPA: branched-chain amino acid ABC transporter substrate-binding protein [Solirubrobacteraceae bacterium]|nr:branched-chain amino acid ABC transporter substrate-binding protein [Solirubrobacteraceae bacterium]